MDIVIGMSICILEFVMNGKFDFSVCCIFVLDEVDCLFDIGN